MKASSRRLRLLGLGGIALGVLLLALAGSYFAVVAFEDARLPELRVQGEVASAMPSPPVPDLPAEGMRLIIPALDIDSPVVHVAREVKDGQLTWGSPGPAVGHLEGTALPGQAGNAVLTGHILTIREGDVFRRLPEVPALLEQGQPIAIWVVAPEGSFLYWVQETLVVEPQDVWVTDPTDEPTLTLITCIPSWNPTHRLVVRAVAQQ